MAQYLIRSDCGGARFTSELGQSHHFDPASPTSGRPRI